MKCHSKLCANPASYVNTSTKVYKCAGCRAKSPDSYAFTWFELKDEHKTLDEDSPLEIPKAKARNNYYCTQMLDTGKWGIHTRDGEYFIVVLEKQEEAEIVTSALNKAFKNGANSVLLDLNSFSLDIRRKNGIIWGDGNTSQNSNY
jgi:hypothetical protein